MTVLEAGSTVVREWRQSDAGQLADQGNDRRVWLGMRDTFPHPYGIDDAHAFIEMATKMLPRTFFAIEVDGRVAGGIGYKLHGDVERISAEVGYWLGYVYWGRGIATTAVGLLTRHAFAANPELRRLYAMPLATNAASARVLEKAGYRREAVLRQSVIKDGRVFDQFIYACLRIEMEPCDEAGGLLRAGRPQ
jgi:RimJ/RimL family protein N-acetyltransferase